MENSHQAISREYAERTNGKNMRRRMTLEEKNFVFQPYKPKRQRPIDGNENCRQPSPPELLQTKIKYHRHINVQEDSHLRVIRQPFCFEGHTKAINTVRWNPINPLLFLSASMDHTVRIWSSATVNNTHSRCIMRHHHKGVKSAVWSRDGASVVSGSYDGTVSVVDADRGDAIHTYTHEPNELITSVCMHPTDPSLFLSGSSRGRILQRDIRMSSDHIPTVYKTSSRLGQVHDLLFLSSPSCTSSRFVSSCAVTARDTSHQTLIVWDFRSTILVSDQLDTDMYAFTCLRQHPSRNQFVAQCSADYIVQYSSSPPYKRHKRFEHHSTQGYAIQCSFHSSGLLLATGDVNGQLILYDTKTRKRCLQSSLYTNPCLGAEFHPTLSTLLTCTTQGQLDLHIVEND